MKRLIVAAALFTALLFAPPVGAVSLQVLESNSEFMKFNQGGTEFFIFLADLRQGSIALKSADLLDRLVDVTQVRDLRSSFPLDEPTRMVDPGLTFDEASSSFSLAIRVARDCTVQPDFVSCAP